jgi:hypothetical protein
VTLTVERIVLHKRVAETVSGQFPKSTFDALSTPSAKNIMVVYVNVSAVSGTTPQMNLQLAVLNPGVANQVFNITQDFDWTDTTGATVALVTNQLQFTATGAVRGRLKSGIKLADGLLQLVWTISGTTPSFTFTGDAIVKG